MRESSTRESPPISTYNHIKPTQTLPRTINITEYMRPLTVEMDGWDKRYNPVALWDATRPLDPASWTWCLLSRFQKTFGYRVGTTWPGLRGTRMLHRAVQKCIRRLRWKPSLSCFSLSIIKTVQSQNRRPDEPCGTRSSLKNLSSSIRPYGLVHMGFKLASRWD